MDINVRQFKLEQNVHPQLQILNIYGAVYYLLNANYSLMNQGVGNDISNARTFDNKTY